MRRLSIVLTVLSLIAGCGKSPTPAELAERAKSAEETTRLEAVRGLKVAPKEAATAIPALTEALRDQNHYVRRDAARALRGYGAEARPAVPALLVAARDRDSAVRRAAVVALREIDPETAAKKLRVR